MKSGLKLFMPAALALVGLMASCTSSIPASSTPSTTSTVSTTSETPTSTPVSTTSETPAPVTLKVAHGYHAPYASKTSNTILQTDVSYVGIVLNEEDVIVDLKIDVMQVKATPSNATTTVLTSAVFPDTTDVKTKWDLLEAYNMNGSLGEWYEQAKALEEYAVGKGLDAFKAELLANEGGFDASVSITVDAFGRALELIDTENFYSEIEVPAADVENVELGIGMSSSQEAKRTNVNMTTALFLEDTILAAEVDVIQIPYAITEVAGDPVTYTIAADTTRAQVDATNIKILSKVSIGEAYNMNGAAGEYFEQVEHLETYLVGKTLAAAFAESALTVDPTHGLVFTDGSTIGVTIGIEDLRDVLIETAAAAGPRNPVVY